MLSPEKLPENLPGGIIRQLCTEINNLDDTNLDICAKTALQFNTAKCILDAYSAGREFGNLIRMMERNNYMLNDREGSDLMEDLVKFDSDYISDSRNNCNKKIDGINGEIYMLPFIYGPSIDLKEYIADLTKRKDTDRIMKVTYVDEWIMYNKLFSNKQI